MKNNLKSSTQVFLYPISDVGQSQEQSFFDHVISMLQEIVISPEFEKNIQHFIS